MERLFFETKIFSGNSGQIECRAWQFGVPDRIGDMIEPGAFKTAKFPLPMLFGHDMNDPVGAWSEGIEKSDGYYLKGDILIEQVVRSREVDALVKAGAVRGISITFIKKQASARVGGGRTIKSLELLEASLVTIPMHPGAKVTSAKSAVQALNLAAAINRATAHLKGN